MYSLINQYSCRVLDRIFQGNHIPDYVWLRQNIGEINEQYQEKYRLFWVMNPAQLSREFYETYFDALRDDTKHPLQLHDLCMKLYKVSKRRNGPQSLQFSFATKLVHMTNPSLPIYDNKIVSFYFFTPPPPPKPRPKRSDRQEEERIKKKVEERIKNHICFYDFLKKEYARILERKLLTKSIEDFRQRFNQEFRKRFNPQDFTNEKIIDSLIWAFVGLLEGGELKNGEVCYS